MRGSEDMGSAKEAQYDFWTRMNQYFKKNKVPVATIEPEYKNCYDFLDGKKGIELMINLNAEGSGKIKTGIFISDDKQVFSKLEEEKKKIEQELGFTNPLKWHSTEKDKCSWIANYIDKFSYDDTSNWEELIEKIAERLVRFQKIIIRVREWQQEGANKASRLYNFDTKHSDTYALSKRPRK
jgi:hypothetical protein